VTELAQHSTEYAVVEHEPPQLMEENLRVGAQLWSSATAFFFFAFLFAYFYLRSLNNSSAWRPKHVDPSFWLGTFAMLAVVAAAVLIRLGLADHRAERRPAWRVKGAVALAFLILALVLQVAEWATQGFGPTDGGYASVYLGWTGMQSFFVLGLAFWLETTLATSIRYRGTLGRTVEPGEASGDRHRTAHDIDDPVSLVRPELVAVSFFATFLAGVVVITWFILYAL
jgi:heme/copper-type cytochrome/quinol oxidase subunit 3